MVKGLGIRGHRNIRHKGFSFYIQEVRGDKLFEASTKINMIERDLYTEGTPETTFSISDEAIQVFLDDLWEAGYRPSDGTGNTGQLKATQDHLADMKKIAFHGLKIKN